MMPEIHSPGGKHNVSSGNDVSVRTQDNIPKSLLWALVNFGFAIIIVIDINHGSISRFLPEGFLIVNNAVKYFEVGLAILFSWNTFFDILLYAWPLLSSKPVKDSLFGGLQSNDSTEEKSSTPSIPTTPKTKIKLVNLVTPPSYNTSPGMTSTPFNPRISNQSFDQSFSSWANSSYTSSPNLSLTSSSWNYVPGQNSPIYSGSRETSFHLLTDSPDSLRMRKNSSFNASNCSSSEFKVTDEKSLENYIKELENSDHKSQQLKYENQAGFNYMNNMMNTSNVLLKKYQYQPACRSPQSSTALANDPDFPATYSGEMVWSKFDISETELNIWNERLRKYLSQTILLPLVAEIDNINDILCRLGSPDLQIGEVSQNSLRQVQMTKGQHLPTLNSLLPYLEISNNQEYLVQRLRDLSKGGCMSEFRWNTGGQYKGKTWSDDLPTDSAIIMHVFCSYLDSRLPADPTYANGKTFTSQYFKKTPDKPTTSKDTFCIYQSRLNPPHFRLIIEEETWDIPKGRSNVLQTILLFLHQVKTVHCGMLGRINLGPSGVNILGVIEH